MAIYDAGPFCNYENEMEYPYFAYMPNNIYENWNNGGKYKPLKHT
jgi:hypothetical protein